MVNFMQIINEILQAEEEEEAKAMITMAGDVHLHHIGQREILIARHV